ncbi:MAG TPA: ArsR family transcriptional regulator [Planctomycetes bacterium]|nr:ArsR family transcriptional regulator [Planctomycetota bacterium]
MPNTDPSERLFEIQARLVRVMGHPARLRILHILHTAEGEVGVSALREELGLAKTGLSQHLSKMIAEGIVRGRKEGRYRYVRLAQPEIGRACDLVRGALARQARERATILGAEGATEGEEP